MKKRIIRRSKEELQKMKGKTDHVFVKNTSDNHILDQVENDPDSHIPSEQELVKFDSVNKSA